MEKACRSHSELYVAKENTGGSQRLRITTLFGHISARSSIPKKRKMWRLCKSLFPCKGFRFFSGTWKCLLQTTQMLQRLRKPVARHGKLTGFCEWLVGVWPGEPIPCC